MPKLGSRLSWANYGRDKLCRSVVGKGRLEILVLYVDYFRSAHSNIYEM